MKQLINALCLLIIFFLAACQTKTAETEEASDTAQPEEIEAVEEIAAPVLLNANLATEEELTGTGLTQDLAAQIVAARPILDMMTLDTMLRSNLDSAAIEALYAKVFVPFNINTTPEDQFKIIPGVGDRMAHEFKEYRPYTKLAQFRKEIGKYVDEDEVARLEQYIFIPVELNSASEEDILALPGVGNRMAHEFEEYRPYESMEQFRKEIGKYVDENELSRLERFVYLGE